MKTLKRFLLRPEVIRGQGPLKLEGDEALHCSRVLRMRPDDKVVLIDGLGHLLRATIKRLSRNCVEFQADGEPEEINDQMPIHLMIGCLKGDKMEGVIRKAVEFGISDIWPLLTERAIARPGGARSLARVERWQKVALSALKQCRGCMAPRVHEIGKIEEALACLPEKSLRIALWEEERGSHMVKFAAEMATAPSIVLFVGPEGGLAPGEVDLMQEKGFNIASLGGRILRAETAAIASMALATAFYRENT